MSLTRLIFSFELRRVRTAWPPFHRARTSSPVALGHVRQAYHYSTNLLTPPQPGVVALLLSRHVRRRLRSTRSFFRNVRNSGRRGQCHLGSFLLPLLSGFPTWSCRNAHIQFEAFGPS